MSTLLRYLLIGSIVALLFMMATRPRQLRALGRKARLVALIYVAVILASAALRVACLSGWLTRGCQVFG